MRATIATYSEPDPRTVIYVWFTERYGPQVFLDPEDAEEFRSAYGGKVFPRHVYGSGERVLSNAKVTQMAHRRGGE
jgi:hypothetical protein